MLIRLQLSDVSEIEFSWIWKLRGARLRMRLNWRIACFVRVALIIGPESGTLLRVCVDFADTVLVTLPTLMCA
jgi:hypothetical protein